MVDFTVKEFTRIDYSINSAGVSYFLASPVLKILELK
jgi:hypothetical protein